MLPGARSNNGFTLVEVVVTIGMLCFVFLIVALSISTGYRAYYCGREQIRMQQFGQLMIEDIAAQLQESSRVTVDADGCGLALASGNESYYYHLVKQDRKIKRDYDATNAAASASIISPPDVEVLECVFTDREDSIQIDLSLRTNSRSGTTRPEYRLHSDVPIPDRSR